jgi:hypothetical protein
MYPHLAQELKKKNLILGLFDQHPPGNSLPLVFLNMIPSLLSPIPHLILSLFGHFDAYSPDTSLTCVHSHTTTHLPPPSTFMPYNVHHYGPLSTVPWNDVQS